MYLIAVFSSRNETLYFANMLRENKIFMSIINTPKEAGQACGISVKFYQQYFELAKQFLLNKPFRSFVGFFKINYINGREICVKI